MDAHGCVCVCARARVRVRVRVRACVRVYVEAFWSSFACIHSGIKKQLYPHVLFRL